MARTVRNPKLDTRSARAKLATRDSIYWVSLAPGCALGYRKGPKGGVWIAKLAKGGLRTHKTLGPDDALDPDGVLAIGYADAETRAREWFAAVTTPERPVAGPYKVRDAIADYLDWFRRPAKSPSRRLRRALAPSFCRSSVTQRLGR
jgi:hypothetical protein